MESSTKAFIVERYERGDSLMKISQDLFARGVKNGKGEQMPTSEISKVAHSEGCAKRAYRKVDKKHLNIAIRNSLTDQVKEVITSNLSAELQTVLLKSLIKGE